MNHATIPAATGAPAPADAPRRWSLLLTSENHGAVGPAGSTFPHAGEKHERVLVVEVPAAAGAPVDQINLRLVGARQDLPVAEFEGYVDGEPLVRWANRDSMPPAGTKLYVGAAPSAPVGACVAIWDAITRLERTDSTQKERLAAADALREIAHIDQHVASQVLAAQAGQAAVPFDFNVHLARQAAWSEKTFGPGARTKGVCDHIRKELLEIESDPLDLREWIDVVILGLDGAWRCGGTPDQIIAGIVAKQAKNEGRTWPDWRTADPDKAIEHDRSADAPASEPLRSPQEAAGTEKGAAS